MSETMEVEGEKHIRIYRALTDNGGACEKSSGERNFCGVCGTALWLYDPNWPELIHPHASAIDTDLPAPPSLVHLMLKYKADWVQPEIGPEDEVFDLYPEESIEDWHRARGLWVE